MPDKHALLGPSSAHRWLVCTPSARLEEGFPSEQSSYTEEGTKAHSLCEWKLKCRILKSETIATKPQVLDDEMDRCTEDYVDFIEEELNDAKSKTPDATLFVEQELDLSSYVPDGFGTSDAAIISDDLLEVIDFKYGKGVRVDAENNPQLRLYALGVYLKLEPLYDFSVIKTVVFQPRLNHVDSETLTVSELMDWANNYVKPRAKQAFDGKGEFCVGEHCRFCKAGHKCRARAEDAFAVIEKSDTAPALLRDEDIEPMLSKLDNAEKWIESVRAYAKEQAISGKKWKGYKLVESRTLRKIPDQVGAALTLQKAGYSQEDICVTKLKGITELERLLGKPQFRELLSDFVIKPQGEPVLVPESDKRQELNILNEMFKED